MSTHGCQIAEQLGQSTHEATARCSEVWCRSWLSGASCLWEIEARAVHLGTATQGTGVGPMLPVSFRAKDKVPGA